MLIKNNSKYEKKWRKDMRDNLNDEQKEHLQIEDKKGKA